MAKTILKKNPAVTVEEQKPKRGRKPKNEQSASTKPAKVVKTKGKTESESPKKSTQKRQPKTTAKSETVKKVKTSKAVKKAVESAKIPTSENKSLIDVIQQQKKQIEELQNKSNNNFVDLKKQVQENNKVFNSILKAEQDKETLRQRVKTAQIKYRTKYMQLEHEKKQWNQTKQELLNIISDLKSELIKYAPDSELFEIATRITQITTKNHVAISKTIKMPKEKV